MKTSLILLLILITLFTCACSDNSVRSDSSSETSSNTDETEGIMVTEKTQDELVNLRITELTAGFTGNDNEIHFLDVDAKFNPYWCSRDIYASEQNGEPINDAVYQRNLKFEELFGVVVKETRATTNITQLAQKSILSGDDIYDVLMLPLQEAAETAKKGMLTDLKSLPGIDFSNNWWDNNLEASLTINGRLYVTVGDLEILDKETTRGVFFNKVILNDYNLESPYTLVENNGWTFDKMYEMSTVVSKDIDGSGKLDEFDQYGILTEPANIAHYINALGGNFAVFNSEGIPEMTLTSEKSLKAFDKACEILYDQVTCYTTGASKTSKTYTDIWDINTAMFGGNRALFMMIGMNNITIYRNMEADFGIIPNPKYDQSQDKYYSTMYFNGTSGICIPITNKDAGQTGVMLEALAALSSITLKPAYYEKCLKSKYLRDNESEEMLDLIFKSRVYDIGRFYGFGGAEGIVSSLAVSFKTELASAYAKIEEKANQDISKLLDDFNTIS